MIWQEEDEANKRISRKVKYLSIVIIIIILIRVVFQLPYYRVAFRKVNPGPQVLARRMNKCQEEENQRHRAVQHQTQSTVRLRETIRSIFSQTKDSCEAGGRRFLSSLVFDYLCWLTSSTTLNSITLFLPFSFPRSIVKGQCAGGSSQRIGRLSIGLRVLQ